MGNLEKRIDHLEQNTWTPPVSHIPSEELAERINKWIAGGGPARARSTQKPTSLRILEILEEAHRRNLTMQLYRRIAKLEESMQPAPPPQGADDMTAEELLASMPKEMREKLDALLKSMEWEDLDEMIEALEQGRTPNLSEAGAAIAEQIARLYSEDSSDTP